MFRKAGTRSLSLLNSTPAEQKALWKGNVLGWAAGAGVLFWVQSSESKKASSLSPAEAKASDQPDKNNIRKNSQ